MVPVPPNVAPTISLELDVDNGAVENYEMGQKGIISFIAHDVFFDRETQEVNTNKLFCQHLHICARKPSHSTQSLLLTVLMSGCAISIVNFGL